MWYITKKYLCQIRHLIFLNITPKVKNGTVYMKKIKYECVYNFINTYNCYWSPHNDGFFISII